MTTRISPELAADMVSGVALATRLTGATIQFYTGAMPASASSAATGTLLASVETLDASPLAFEEAGNAVTKSSSQDWRLDIVAAGTIGYMRLTKDAARIDTDELPGFPALTLATELELAAFALYVPTED